DVERAQKLWQEVSDSPLSSLARAQAGYALILSKYGAGKMTRLDAIEALDDILRRMHEHVDKKRPLLRRLGSWHRDG
ncbi:hypothetical protein ACO1MN_16370, partial [Staphylococcus aureus]